MSQRSPFDRSFEDVRFSATLNTKILATDVINLIRTRSFHNMISRSLNHILFSERHFVKWFSLSKTPVHPGSILFKFAGTLL